ncbi:hypothetical protein yc1106_07699 [Curvularia clavata]|uniref:DUF7708 domain-containing protein n=1 Tax=Curvularia clavata TaxID=95742 RepID=A0A9Q9DVY9_CURCL|nr:hypothetical protein yc1106_07699 [Curvularia clavata]
MADITDFGQCVKHYLPYRHRTSSKIAEEAFSDAKIKFENDLSKNVRKIQITRSSTSVKDVQNLLVQAKAKYDSARRDSKVQKWLVKLAERIHFYGSVLDVFAQHHPEYVALAWGSIKFLLTATLNHEKTLATLAKAMARIADALPRAELQSVLYPTKKMKSAMTDLYAYLLRFFIRARDWYEESTIKSVVYAVLRPVELRYNELLEQITEVSRTIDQLAVTGQQAEFRDMHLAIQSTGRKVDTALAMMQKMSADVTLHSSGSIDTNVRLFDLQFDRIMSTLRVHLSGPKETYEYHQSLRRQRPRGGGNFSSTNNFWGTAKMRHWSSTSDSVLAIISANFQSRFIMRDFCVDIVEQMKQAGVPYLLAMKTSQISEASGLVSTSQLMKYLIKQAISIKRERQSEKTMALSCAMFHDASTDTEWFSLLASVLADFGTTVYIIVDLCLLDDSIDRINHFSWISAFEQYFENLTARGSTTRIKVLFISYGASQCLWSETEHAKFVIQAKTQQTTARYSKIARSLQAQPTSFQLYNLYRD